ncbi:MAG: ribosome biogenesis factor YjgA [Pseudomonadota bacterium]|nr:ribosome biogenesis factor YjgA [Pseudomonadota bacterium]
MRGRDQETGEYFSPSRSEQRRAALDVLALAQLLVEKTQAELGKLPMDETLQGHVLEAKRITSPIARKRAVAFLAKQMRKEDEEVLEAIREALDANSEGSRRQVALMHRAESWRTRLLEGGDEALAAFLAEHPETDRQRLRQLLRNAQEENRRNKPPRAFRELYRLVHETLTGGANAGSDAADNALGAENLE